MTQMTELPEDTKSAIIHLYNLLNRDGLADFSSLDFHDDKAVFVYGEFEEVVECNVHNPIQAVLNNVFEEVCTDCLKLDYYFADPFFVSLIKGYLEGLVAKYGNIVPITKTIAQVSLKHSLTKHDVCFKVGEELYVVDNCESQMFNNPTRAWFLRVKQNE